MPLSATYRAARFAHIRRLGMQATFAELRAMETKLKEQHDVAAAIIAPLFYGTDEENAIARHISQTVVYPAARLLEIVREAITTAAERSINSHAVANRAARRGKSRRGLLSLQEMQERSAIGRALFRASRQRIVW